MFSETLNEVLHPWVVIGCQILIMGAMLLSLLRVIRGPNVVDRVAALDLLAGIILALTILQAIVNHEASYMNIGIAIALIVFMGTVAISRYLEKREYPVFEDKPKRKKGKVLKPGEAS